MARKSPIDMKLQQKQIWDLYIAGEPLNSIAVKVGVTYRSIQANLKKIVNDIDVTKDLDREIATDLTRLETLFRRFWPYAVGIGGANDGAEPSIEYGEFILKVLDRKAKLLGLDANKRVDIYAIIESWSSRNGFDPVDVIDVVGDLLPSPSALTSSP